MKITQTTIPCSIIRGGTSRGVFFRFEDLPSDEEDRNVVILAVIGGPDSLQVDGPGGGHPLTCKVAIVGPSSRDDADVDFLFLQVIPTEQRISTVQNCGNILAGVGPFSIESGFVAGEQGSTRIRVHMLNSGNRCELNVPTPDGVVEYTGSTAIDGVPGTASEITCDYLDIAGSVTGALLPSGELRDEIDGVAVTCIDNGMPVVLVRAADVNCSGYEHPEELDNNEALKERLENIRLAAGHLMNLGDVTELTVPKVCLIAEPTQGGNVSTRTFIPHVCHRSIGVLGAVSVASACLLQGSVADNIAAATPGSNQLVAVEHPKGLMLVRLTTDDQAPIEKRISRAGVVRTARLIMQGEVFVPEGFCK